MKRILIALVLLIVLIGISSNALARTAYNMEKDQFVVVAFDEEKNEAYTTVITRKSVERLIKANVVCEIYYFECDGLIKLDWEIAEEEIIFTNTITNEKF